MEGEEVVEVAGEEVVGVEHGAGEEAGAAAAEDTVAGELGGDALGGDGGVELHDATVGGDNPNHGVVVVWMVAMVEGEAFEDAVSH